MACCWRQHQQNTMVEYCWHCLLMHLLLEQDMLWRYRQLQCMKSVLVFFTKTSYFRKQMYRLWTASYSKAFFRYLFLVHWQSGKRKKVPKRSIFKMTAKKKSSVFKIHKNHLSYLLHPRSYVASYILQNITLPKYMDMWCVKVFLSSHIEGI